jgi:hypothetical protein
MKALTLQQPWASMVDVQAKTLETRSWYTDYRGELVIHASTTYSWDDYEYELKPEFRSRLLNAYPLPSLPRGVALCVVKVVGCVKTTDVHKLVACGFPAPSVNELLFGNFQPGRYAWALEYVRRLDHRPEVMGARGLWDFPDHYLEAEQ